MCEGSWVGDGVDMNGCDVGEIRVDDSAVGVMEVEFVEDEDELDTGTSGRVLVCLL